MEAGLSQSNSVDPGNRSEFSTDIRFDLSYVDVTVNLTLSLAFRVQHVYRVCR